jgi:hypothetical protein
MEAEITKWKRAQKDTQNAWYKAPDFTRLPVASVCDEYPIVGAPISQKDGLFNKFYQYLRTLVPLFIRVILFRIVPNL